MSKTYVKFTDRDGVRRFFVASRQRPRTEAGYPAPCTTPPHIVTLSTWDEGYDDEDFGAWDYAEIHCPHQPPTEHMPCAVWDLCGCRAVAAEMTVADGGTGTGTGRCPRSATGVHHHIEGEPNRPECWTRDWDASIEGRAFDLGLSAGTYLVHPWWDGDTIQLDLIDPVMKIR